MLRYSVFIRVGYFEVIHRIVVFTLFTNNSGITLNVQ